MNNIFSLEMYVIVLIIVVLVITIIFKDMICRYTQLKLTGGIVIVFTLFLCLVLYVCETAEDNNIIFSSEYKKLFTVNQEVPDNASIYLWTIDSETFELTSNTLIEGLEEFLDSCDRNIYLCVKVDNEIVFSHNFGVCSFKDAEWLYNNYIRLREDKAIITDVYRHTIFKVFYYDKEVLSNVYKQEVR